MSRSHLCLGVLAALAIANTTHAQLPTLRIGTLDGSRNGNMANFFNGELTEELRESLRAHCEGLEIVPAPRLEDTFLSGVELLILHNLFNEDAIRDNLSAAEQEWLLNFVREGGSVLLILDYTWTDAATPFVAPFELEVQGDVVDDYSLDVADQHPVMQVPFGIVSGFRMWGGGWFTDLGPHATALARTAANGAPSIVAIEAGELGPGSGRMVIAADANPFADGTDGSKFYFPEHEILFLNIVHWLTDGRSMFLRGDCNDDGAVDISNASCILNWLFAGADNPPCEAAANPNGDAAVDISDASYLLNWLFLGGPAPAQPFPECGASDLEADQALGCEESSCP